MTSPLNATGSYSQTNPQKASSTRRKIPAYLQKMNSAEKAANDKIIQSMQTKINYLKNPRFRINRPPISFQQNATTYANDTKDPFRVSPEVVVFTEYDVNCVYEIPVTITNATGILKRVKHMPPATPEFSVSHVKYPTSETGIIASGLSMIVYVNFLATSLSDFDDELLIVTEESSFTVKLQARREHPVLTLPEILDCQGCWLGDRVDMVFQFSNKAGKANYKFFCENEEDDQKQNGEILQLENFTVYPPEFSISKGEKRELYVCFTPKREGIIEERVILACDNNTSKVYTVRAIANTAELKVTKVNGNLVEGTEEFKTLYITQVEPKFPKSSVLTVKNDTFVKVNYHWVINDEKVLKDEDDDTRKHTRYSIEPEKGVFEPNSEKDFKIMFESDVSIPFYKNISLVIDDVPFEAIKNPPELIRQQYMDYINVGEDTKKERPSLTYFQFSVVSDVLFNRVSLSPPVYFFQAPLLIKNEHQHGYCLKNHSEGPIDYQVKLHSKTSDFLSCRVLNDKGTIPAKGEVNIEVVIWSDKPAVNQRCVFIVEVQNCDPIAFQIGASFQGPRLRILQSIINFGLVRTHTSPSFVLEVENVSEVQAEVLMRRKDEEVSFQDYKTEDPYYQWWDNLVYFDPQYFTLAPHEIRQINVILNARHSETIEEIVEILVLDGQKEHLFLTAEVQGVYVTLNRFSLNFPELFTGKFYEISEGHDQRIVLINYGNIPAKFEWPDLKGVFEATFEPKSGIIPGKTEIPIILKMVPQVGMNVNKIIECNIEGLDGPVGLELTAKVAGLSVTYEIHEEELSSHSKNKKKPGLAESLTSLQAKSPRSLTGTSLSMISRQHVEATRIRPPLEKIELMDMKINEPRSLKFVLKNLSGLNTSFLLYSENFEPKAHKVDSLADLHEFDTNPTLTSGRSHQNKKLAAISPPKYGGGKKKVNDPLLSAAIEKVQNFTSVDGKALNKARRLEKDQKFYLTNNKGVAIVCEPYQGELKAYEEILVTLTIYNDACGKYEDALCSEIKGLPLMKFPVKLNITGSPLVVSPNQVGVDYKSDYPILNLEPRMHSLGVYTKQVKLTNTSPQEMSLEWKIYNLDGDGEGQADLFSIKLGEPKVGSKDIVGVKWLPIPPQESEYGPFKINPKSIKIKPRCTEVFTISFATPSVNKFDAVAVGETELLGDTGDEHKNSNRRNSLPFYLKAETVYPLLTLDKLVTLCDFSKLTNSKKRADGSQVIKLEKWALTQAKKQIKNIILRNHTPAHLDFTMQVDGPFKVREIKTSSLEKYEISPLKKDLTYKPETRVTLRSEAFLEVLIEFEGFNEKDHEKWPLCPSVHIPGLIHIKHANGDYQSFDLEGVLRRSVLEINTAGFEGKPVDDIIDFDVCHIHNFVQKTIYLVNLTKVPGKWKLNYIKYPTKKLLGIATVTKMDLEDAKKTDDPDVFEFSMTEGVIGGKTIPVNKVPEGKAFEGYMTKTFHGMSLPPGHRGTMRNNATMSSTLAGQTELPTKIMINFKPKMNILYKSKFRITVEEGPSIDIILRGTGSYEEKIEK